MSPLEYTVRRSDRARRARLTVDRLGNAVVVLPRRAPEGTAEQLVTQHHVWLRRAIERARRANARIAERPALDEGRVLWVGGVPYRVWIRGSSGARASVKAHAPQSEEAVGLLEVVPTERSNGADVLEAWLRREAGRVLAARVAHYARVMGLPIPPITVRGQSSRWGSASAAGRLSLNWRLLLTPPFVRDFVVVHELAHLRWHGHGARFWGLVQKYVPDVRSPRKWLRDNHGELLAALD
jgi:predicted metal-dependent hydrolase